MKYILLAFFSIVFLACCKKKPSAGLGGNANLTISSQHHGSVIDSATVYIKFNTQEAPTNLSDYDLSKPTTYTAIGTGTAYFEGLKAGDYYIYSEGWDPSINERVNGGIPYTIKDETTLNIIVPVTEQH